jgi:hypothetical protein
MNATSPQRFRKMADAIERNVDNFGGAFVVVPPVEAGEPIETLILDARQDAAQFWILLKSKCEQEIAKTDEKQRLAQGFARR